MKLVLIFAVIIGSFLLYTGNTLKSATKGIIPPVENFEGLEKSKKIAIIGDMQRTSIWELVLGREQNDLQRSLLVESIAEENPQMLVLLGDMVVDGSSDLQWDFFDSLVNPLRLRDIPLYPVLGNHEYWGKRSDNHRLISNRFPALREKSWYALTHDGLALIFLNSNESDMSSYDWNDQREWFNNRIYKFENDPSIKGIFVFTHHPPYTNSTITTDEIHVQRAFTPAFLKAKKTIAFVSGHAHTYERFNKEGKLFIVSGGGGGPRVLLKLGPDCHEDLCKEDPVRPFHYLMITRNETEVDIEVKALKEETGKFYILERVSVPIPFQAAQASP